MTTIRRLTPPDAEAFVDVRARALNDEPLAFGSSPEDDSSLSIEVTRERLRPDSGSATFGVFDPELVGIAGWFRTEMRKINHRATIWGVYVDPSRQGRGLGRRLVEAVLDDLRHVEGVTHAQLSVTESQPAALRLYERLGFVRWGTEPDSLRWRGRTVDQHYLILRL